MTTFLRVSVFFFLSIVSNDFHDGGLLLWLLQVSVVYLGLFPMYVREGKKMLYYPDGRGEWHFLGVGVSEGHFLYRGVNEIQVLL